MYGAAVIEKKDAILFIIIMLSETDVALKAISGRGWNWDGMGWKYLGRAMLRAPSMLIIWREKRIETSSIFHTFPPQSTIIESNTLSKEKGWRKTYRMA